MVWVLFCLLTVRCVLEEALVLLRNPSTINFDHLGYPIYIQLLTSPDVGVDDKMFFNVYFLCTCLHIAHIYIL